MLMIRFGPARGELGRDDLHVAREHDDVGACPRGARSAAPRPAAGCRACSGRARTARRTSPPPRAGPGGSRPRRRRRRARRSPRFHVQRSSSSAWSCFETRIATRSRCSESEPPVHRERARDVEGERALEVLERKVERVGLELEAREVDAAVFLGGVLVEVGDVRPVAEQEARDRGDDPGAVGALDEEDGSWSGHGAGQAKQKSGAGRALASARARGQPRPPPR